jgi:SAM-dependent methyltransferase
MAERVTRGGGLLEAFLARKRAAMANRLIPDAARDGDLLDVGCGSHPFFLLQAPVARPCGVDKLVPAAGRSIGDVSLRHFDAERSSHLPFESQAFDVVTMLAVFEHIPPDSLVPLLADVRRVLRPGGTFIMTTPAGWADPILRTMARLRLVSPEEIDEHQDRYDRPFIRRVLGDAGFPDTAVETGTFELGMNLWARASVESKHAGS